MSNMKENKTLKAVLTGLRILIGWHFLYEGLSKLANPGWSSAGYLMESKWLFAGFFHWLIATPSALSVADFLNVWGLIFIGLGLFLGLFTRISAISGVFLMLLYYVANPPFMSSGVPSEGHYYLVNKNLIEAAALIVVASLAKGSMWSLDRMLLQYFQRRKEHLFPSGANHEILDSGVNPRRELIKNLAVMPVLGGALFGMAQKSGWLSFEEKSMAKTDGKSGATTFSAKGIDLSELKAKVPMGKIKHVELSRIIPGGNLVSGFAHARDLIYVSPLIKNYFTDEKVIETLWLYEACGINTTIMRCDEQTIRILQKFWSRGGKIQWLAQTYPKKEDISNVKLAIDNGAVGTFVMGNIADKYVLDNELEHIVKPVEFIRSQGLIAGVAGHSIKTPMACVENKIETDFFMKTFHHNNYWSTQPEENRGEFNPIKPEGPTRFDYHDNIWCASAEDTAGFFKNCKTPWIAYKVLAAGAIKPEDGIKFAFENGADFTCVGMFDFQVIDNANLVTGLLGPDLKRERKWYS
jgi:uncharacterized membrane protein YphA (DoxX/SURF4 family)